MKDIQNQLSYMNIEYDTLIKIQSKDGILVYRVNCGNTSYILKYFLNSKYRREIENYKILQSIGVQTLNIIKGTDCSLLLEDISISQTFRLGTLEDMNDSSIAKHLARWYKELHNKSKQYVMLYGKTMYDESDVITIENLKTIALKTNTEDNSIWSLLLNNFSSIKSCIDNIERTLTYNDFYYTNLIVAKDKSSVFMFDYNLLGKGYVYSDIRNVTFSLNDLAKDTFMYEYGKINKTEVLVNNVASVLVSLYFASQRDTFPSWAEGYLKHTKNGTLESATRKLLYSSQ